MANLKRIVILSLLMGILSSGSKSMNLALQGLCPLPHKDISIPLTDLGNATYVRVDGQATTFTGGLYPGGSNIRPSEHEAAGLRMAGQIMPLDRGGKLDLANGKIVMIAVGMSNANQEFGRFIDIAQQDQQVSPRLVLVNTAIPGFTAEYWAEPDAEAWQHAKRLLDRSHLTSLQVQAAWVKQTLTGGGNFPAKAQELQAYLEAIVHSLKLNYPNLKIAYLSSRTRSYEYRNGLSPEPLAFETGFAVKWLIEKQIDGDPSLNFDPQRGEVLAPYLSWGPYLWIDGLNPRSDGRVWTPEDLVGDCTHPSPSGEAKVAEMMMAFFKTDSTAAGWFLASGEQPGSTTPATSPSPSETPTNPPSPSAKPTQEDTPTPTVSPSIPKPSDTPRPTASKITETPPATLNPLQPPSDAPSTLPSRIIAVTLVGAAILAVWLFLRRK